MNKPLSVDLFCGVGGWTEGLIAEGYEPIGFDIERHVYGSHAYPAQLVLQDVLTLHGSQFREAALIVASPPCQKYSYMAMPWSIGKKKAKAIRADETGVMLAELNALFNACFRIQREASEAAGRHIPMVVENVRGAIPWVGYSRWNFGSYHLWGDVPAIMPITFKGFKSSGMNWSDQTKRGQDFTRIAGQQAMEHIKVPSEDGRRTDKGNGARFTSRDCGAEGIKCGGDWFNDEQPSIPRMMSSRSPARKAASALIAKIPFRLARHIAAVWRPRP